MSAYIVVEVEVHDPETYENYKAMVPPSLTEYGGRFLVRGGRIETLEGDWSPKRFVMVEFPSVDKARAWWDSAGYAEAKALRQATAKTQMIVVEGVDGVDAAQTSVCVLCKSNHRPKSEPRSPVAVP